MSGIAVFGIILLVLVGLVGVGVVARSLLDDNISESDWKPLEVPNRFKVSMPGTPRQAGQDVAGLQMVQHLVEPNRNTAFLVAYSEGLLPPHRIAIPPEELLNDACDGAARGIGEEGGVEISRESIQMGRYPGKLLIIDMKKRNVKMISRLYLVDGRLYMLVAAGRNYTPDHANVKRFFDSFELLDKNQGPAPKSKMKR